jgi:hypothetical protein
LTGANVLVKGPLLSKPAFMLICCRTTRSIAHKRSSTHVFCVEQQSRAAQQKGRPHVSANFYDPRPGATTRPYSDYITLSPVFAQVSGLKYVLPLLRAVFTTPKASLLDTDDLECQQRGFGAAWRCSQLKRS